MEFSSRIRHLLAVDLLAEHQPTYQNKLVTLNPAACRGIALHIRLDGEGVVSPARVHRSGRRNLVTQLPLWFNRMADARQGPYPTPPPLATPEVVDPPAFPTRDLRH